MSFLMGYVVGMATSRSRNSSRHNFEEEQLKTKCKKLEHQIADLSKTIERLQEQMKEANEVINDDLSEANSCFAVGRIRKYKEKWGVK